MGDSFRPVSSRVDFPEMEKAILQFWKEKDIFHRTELDGDGKPLFMLYEGPPTANGSPGVHHILARAYKDIICRYKTMKGYRCLRKGGWDTHGLPVELEVERELGLKTKRDIEEYGIEEFNQKCKESVFRYVKEWEDMTDRIGFWVDMEHPYVTLDNDYVETGWWILKQLWDKGLLRKDLRGTPHCPRCVTSLSSHEVALGYQENTPGPSVFIKFHVTGWPGEKSSEEVYSKLFGSGKPVYFLAWTTTPWTLPGNTALAIDATAEYSLVEEVGDTPHEGLILLASPLLDKVMKGPYEVVAKFTGSELVGLTYNKLYDAASAGQQISQFEQRGDVVELKQVEDFVPRVVATDFVSMEDGTGIVHIAPAFGDEDLSTGRQHGLGFVQSVDLQGVVMGGYPFAGEFVKDADEQIIADLKGKGLLYHKDVYHHTYPFCWRCNAPLLYYAKSSWYIRTTAVKDRLISGNREINWYPDYIKDGRFGEWLANNVDWAISRERYWGTPLPIWHCDSCDAHHCIGSVAELKEMAIPEHQEMAGQLDLHRPSVDQVAIRCPNCQKSMRRVPEVLDAWFDSGAMPFAQYHVTSPEDVARLEEDGRLPADYICEAVDQTRGWFYSLHALSTLLTKNPSYRNVICLGLILDGKGQKMSKRLGNVVNPWTVLDAQGADAVRWYLFTASQPGESRRFSQDLVTEVVRRFLLTLWNVYSFFTTYALVDRFHPSQAPKDWAPTSELDRWLMSELHSLITQVDRNLDGYSPTDAGRRIQEFVDRLSNWYVRRSRRRFWRSESDEDKTSGYVTLYQCLTTLCKLIAPFMPFVAEEMYQNLVRSLDPDAPESVHLAAFPEASPEMVDQSLMEATRLAMKVSSMGRGARSRAGMKVRQPLSKVLVKPRTPEEAEAVLRVRPQILDELNIKDLEVISGPSQSGGQNVGQLYQRALETAGNSGGEGASSSQVEAIVQVGQYWASLEGGYMVALDTNITPDLAQEGLARELVHRIQNLRKAAKFEITDRITTYYRGNNSVQEVMGKFSSYIQEETLSNELIEAQPEEGAHSENQKLEGAELVLGVKRVG